MKKPILNEKFADNGEHSHWELIDANTGEVLWGKIDAVLPQAGVIKSVCKHKRKHFDITFGGWFCKDCNEKISGQTVL